MGSAPKSDQADHNMRRPIQQEQEGEKLQEEQRLCQREQHQTNSSRLTLQLLVPFYKKRLQVLQLFDAHDLLRASPHRDYAAEIAMLSDIQDRYRELMFDLRAIRLQVDLDVLDPSLRKFFSGSRLLELLSAVASLVVSTQRLVKREEQSGSHLPFKETDCHRRRQHLQ